MWRGMVRSWLGVARSLAVYWRPGRQRGLRRLYAEFVGSGDLVFDVGAHVGDRTAAFAALGARVVALEPQPAVLPWLERRVGRMAGVTIRAEAVGRVPGTATLAVSSAHPTVSTLAEDWRRGVGDRNPSFAGVRWDGAVEVPVTTLDRLIETWGVPTFCKIDVEGHEAEVLAGLSRPVPALSFEFVAGTLDVPRACVALLAELGRYEYNVILGERRRFVFPAWRSAADLEAWLDRGAEGASSGDVYARLHAT
jgi:FkbM family methyltransferase